MRGREQNLGAARVIDMETWPHSGRFALFRTFQRPHYAITARLDVTHLMRRKAEGVSPYRACLYAIGRGVADVPELRLRMRGAQVLQYETAVMSMTVPREDGSFGFGYLALDDEFPRFDAHAAQHITEVRQSTAFEPSTGEDAAMVYVSCLPWVDFTALDNALPGPEDCIPRVAWGKFTPEGDQTRMAMAIQVHHALVDGVHLGQFFEAVQATLDAI